MADWDVEAFLQGLSDRQKRIEEATYKAAEEGGQLMVEVARRYAPYRTGHLWESIEAEPPEENGYAKWTVHVSPHTIYDAVQEYGGILFPHGQWLHWIDDMGSIWKKFVVVPEHPYMRPMMREVASEVDAMIARAFLGAL